MHCVPTRFSQSKRCLTRGFCLLLLGSALLLLCKMALPLWGESLCLFTGGALVLLGNGWLLFGLLIHADSRVYASDNKPKDILEEDKRT